jgi:hypothetical protein
MYSQKRSREGKVKASFLLKRNIFHNTYCERNSLPTLFIHSTRNIWGACHILLDSFVPNGRMGLDCYLFCRVGHGDWVAKQNRTVVSREDSEQQ